ncbi:MAG: ArsR/SmtB family transcription factor [Cytophagales bacterium]
MGITKTDSFNHLQNKRAKYFKALGHPARIAIVEMLISKQACICNDMVEELPLSQSTISQHLKELKEAGIIKGDIEGQKICYCINDEVWKDAQLELNILFGSHKTSKNCC